MTNKEYQNRIKELKEDISNTMEEYNSISFAESQILYSLMGYIDKRFDLLKECCEKV